MVAIVKGLFITQRSWEDLEGFLKTSSEAIRQMRLGSLYMGLALARIKDRTLTVASAGMPPLFLYRKATRSVEEFVIKSMPLGGPGRFNYDTRSTPLNAGDVLLMVSDGLPELFNPQRETLDYPRLKDLFLASAERSATEIVHHLASAGREWAAELPQEDDITIVAVKLRH